jgi:5-oxoprolinase (ATP-hydrolysing)
LVDAHPFQGKDRIFSGSASVIVGAVSAAQRTCLQKIISFDMSGTSTDVIHFAGELERSFETEIADVRMRALMMLIHTVASDGCSILTDRS